MAQRLEVYKCDLCGNIIEVMHGGDGTLVCCGEDMKLQVEGTVDAAREKHVPVIHKTASGYKVVVGEVAHPMLDAHYIEWIELVADGKVYRQYLNPGQAPEAEFCIEAKNVTAREYCNLHGQWKIEN
ncbi:desulfoferrodoxin [Desulfomicrobium baculatum]|uniref:Desulfoferrodoxin n=1 Tax=Desulfomicrobium baculatum (strain DSM 4028 / VKM B-1378 / X) TaxID=525897 RepID=C7LS45_DESBD|nr:desulfoferrodoxin [Desulfomicrobium baculatum]ACU90593.1 desulfoferrodoxin [Desulfomicrobium baculatum DSM 4028]